MAPNSNTALRIAELDFAGIKKNLKDFLRNQNEFKDFDFEGSGMSVLLDVLAYNTHYMSYYLNMVGNEMFLDTAQLRPSILSHAKMINYIPQSRIGAMAQVDVRVTPDETEDQDAQLLTIDRYTRFIGEDIDGVNYPFVALHSNTVSKSGDNFFFNNIWLKQGEAITRQFTMTEDNINRRFTIPSANVDMSTVMVTVQRSSTDTTSEAYTKADDLTELTPESRVYFIEEGKGLKYHIYFGDGVIGKKPDIGNIIRVSYIDTDGPQANKIKRFFTSELIGPFSGNIKVKAEGPSFGGSERESIKSIRFNAPNFYTAQNRAVTKRDYETLLKKDYPFIQSVAVWGGEDNDEIQYGKVFISIKTIDNYALSELEKENIKETLIKNRNVLTVQPEIVDPNVVYIKLKGKVVFNPKLTKLTAGEIKKYVLAAIDDYVNDDLNRFDSVFRKSKLQYYIDNAEPSIVASDLELYVQKRQFLETGLSKTYRFKFGMPLKQGDFINRLKSYPYVVVEDNSNDQRKVYIEEVPESYTGIARIRVLRGGSGYISQPTVQIIGDGTGAVAQAVVVNGKIQSINVLNAGANYTRADVSISGGGGTGAVASAVTDVSVGALRTYFFKNNGQKVIVNNNVGEINYASGIVTLNSFVPLELPENDLYELDTLTIDAPAENDILYPVRNTILSIDSNDASAILIDIVAEG